MYCYVCNLTLFLLKWAYLQSIHNYIKLAEESQEDSKLISPSILIYESWCKCEKDRCEIVIAKVNIIGCLKRLLAKVLMEEILNVHRDAETVS